MQYFDDVVVYPRDNHLPTIKEESECLDQFSDGTLSRCNSLERLKLPEGYVEEVCRVDRTKLQSMILGCPPEPWDREVMNIPIDKHGRVKAAEEFFQEIMDATNTIINYPKNLKLRSRNKGDPPVRVIGSPEKVQEAIQRIYFDLVPQNRVTLKIDIPWTTHSNIIGKGGNTIQPVVKRTGVSIHFPDGNKNSDRIKSNQVSINARGTHINGLEEARYALRSLSPLVFSFMIRAVQIIRNIDTEALVTHIQSVYNVQAVVSKMSDQIVSGSVKGGEWDADRVKEATLRLLAALCGDIANILQVQTNLEISPIFHQGILGRYRERVRTIERVTETKIIFPDLNDLNAPPLMQYVVKILGSVENVYSARAKIIGSIPVQLLFEADAIAENEISLLQYLGVTVTQKFAATESNRRLFSVRGEERNVGGVYEAWRLITRSQNVTKAKIPPSYFVQEVPVIAWPPHNSPSPPNCGFEYSTAPCSYPNLPPSPIDVNNNCLFYPEAQITHKEPPTQVKEGAWSSPTPVNGGLLPSLTPVDGGFFPTPSRMLGGVPSSPLTSYMDPSPSISPSNSYSMASPLWPVSDIQPDILKNLWAYQATQEPIDSVRTPNGNLCGGGLSKTVSEYTLKEMKINSGCEGPKSPSYSQYLEPQWQKSVLKKFGSEFEDVKPILILLRLEQYIEMFSMFNIDMDTFMHLSEQDLVRLGVHSHLHRETIMMAAKKLRLGLDGIID